MRNTIRFMLAASCFVLPLVAQAGVPEAVSYLKTQTLDDWGAQALVAAGESVDAAPLKTFTGSNATDYAKRILALVAAKQNPTSYTGADLVAGLRGFEQAGQIGDVSLLNDDAWGIMALRAAGYSTSDGLVKGAAQHLIDNQNADGGWSWSVGFDSDTNDTAAGLMALSEAGYSSSHAALQAGVAYLVTQQNADAGFPYQLPCFWPGCEASDSASTAWVISALTKLQLNPSSWTKSGDGPQDFLLSLQTGDGSFKWQLGDPAGSAAMTAYALVALVDKVYPVARGSYVGSNSSGPTPMADLEIGLSSANLTAEAGEQVGLVIKLVNNGPTMAQAVVVQLELPAGVELVQATPTDGTFNAEEHTWNFIRFNNFATASLALTLTPRAALADEVKVVARARELDIDLANNTASVGLEVTEPTPAPSTEPVGEVLGEITYSCEPAPDSLTPWPGRSVSAASSATAWYVDPVTGSPYCLSDAAAAYAALERFGLGITNADLARLPAAAGEPVTVEAGATDAGLVERLRGRIVLQVESLGEAWYVEPVTGLRYYLADGAVALERFRSWRITVQ